MWRWYRNYRARWSRAHLADTEQVLDRTMQDIRVLRSAFVLLEQEIALVMGDIDRLDARIHQWERTLPPDTSSGMQTAAAHAQTPLASETFDTEFRQRPWNTGTFIS